MTVPRAQFCGERASLNAANQHTCKQGMCLQIVRNWAGIPSRYPSALAAWKAIPSSARHTGTPPRGSFVYWYSSTFGHIAWSLGGGMVRSSDVPSAGRVGNISISDLRRKWPRVSYLGWSWQCNGYSAWAPTIDASSILAVAKRAPYTAPGSLGNMVKLVEASLAARRDSAGNRFFPLDAVNTYWGVNTTTAWKKWEARLGVTRNGEPSLTELRLLARLQPYRNVRP
jgi:hypothetical protein